MNKFLLTLLILAVYKVSSQNLFDSLSNPNPNPDPDTDLTEGSGTKFPYVETVPYTPEELEDIIAKAIVKMEQRDKELQDTLDALNATTNG
ncbi:hypothetical protein WR25_06904 [Diploscapter pachys]|uniref:Secreted protein n=1 Tax=Diploscapter pachys TaxID=2018661 RepID=A0A2A2L417_9BILA|nr:hypothetical protein WR25_06904 [Diploscapter pachys]